MMICSLRAVKAVRQLQGSLGSCAAVARLENRYRAALATETTRGTFKYNQRRYSGERLNFVISAVRETRRARRHAGRRPDILTLLTNF